MDKKLFIAPRNDAEAVEIITLLNEQGEKVLVTSQAWGATWANLEPEIKTQVEKFDGVIYGVELAGPAPAGAVNIDHHFYDGDDRRNPLTAIEQVAELLGVDLSVEQQFIAANDKDYIPGMLALGEKLGMGIALVQKYVHIVRAKDRAAQGITTQQEEIAVKAIEAAGVVDFQRLVVVRMEHSKCSPVTDRLFGLYENLLILSGDGESNFYGEGNVCLSLKNTFSGWAGGNLPINGYWGGYADQKAIEEKVRELLAL